MAGVSMAPTSQTFIQCWTKLNLTLTWILTHLLWFVSVTLPVFWPPLYTHSGSCFSEETMHAQDSHTRAWSAQFPSVTSWPLAGQDSSTHKLEGERRRPCSPSWKKGRSKVWKCWRDYYTVDFLVTVGSELKICFNMIDALRNNLSIM